MAKRPSVQRVSARRAAAMAKPKRIGYGALLGDPVDLLEEARRGAVRSFGAIMTAIYWMIDRHILEYEYENSRMASVTSSTLQNQSVIQSSAGLSYLLKRISHALHAGDGNAR